MEGYKLFSMAYSAAGNYVMFSVNSSHSAESAGTVAVSNFNSVYGSSVFEGETAGSVACSSTSSSGGGFSCSGGSYSAVA